MIIPEGENTMPDFPAADWSSLVDLLAVQGHAVLPAALPAASWIALQAEARQLLGQGAFAPARIGRGDSLHRESSVRGDGLCWLEPGLAAGSAYLRWMEGLRLALNRELFLGLDEFEAHYAHYPVGAFYRRHVDRHRDSNARVISSVFYLNAHWREEEGGELLMQDEAGEVLFAQPPRGGTLVLFKSADMPHEVLPATRERWSIAGWFRTRS
ncbi:MAG: 2OG-Fe(II) oxygenase [Pedobacter sp.]|nr:2OG-Fe(II) oxygenase [Pedobacter sp.]